MNELIAYGGITLTVILTGIGSSIGVIIAGNATTGSMERNPDALGQYIGLSALPSSQGLYGFVGSFVANGLIKNLPTAGVLGANVAWAIFAAELSLGLVGLYSAIRQAQVRANGIKGIGVSNSLFSATMVTVVFPELYAILTLLVSILTFGAVRGLFLAAQRHPVRVPVALATYFTHRGY